MAGVGGITLTQQKVGVVLDSVNIEVEFELHDLLSIARY